MRIRIATLTEWSGAHARRCHAACCAQAPCRGYAADAMTIEIPVPFVTHKLDKPPSQTVETSKSARPAPRRRGTPCHARRGAGRRLVAACSRRLHAACVA